MNWQNIEVVDTFNYLGLTLGSTGCWKKQKSLAEKEGYEAVTPTDKCISATPSIKVQMLEYIQYVK
jgi:hypothetical protein